MITKIICWFRGHDWDQLPYEDSLKGWTYERHVCLRCGAFSRILVAGKLG